jgi:glycosyltransferase involved in cell wall biosynthesis
MDHMDIFKKNKVVVVSGAPLIQTSEGTFLYKPYETEMQLWAKYASEISFCCPIWKDDRRLLKSEVSFKINSVTELEDFNLKSKSIKDILTIFKAVFYNLFQVYKAMQVADHIHLRCPGNIGLIGCVVQILFPNKNKTAKYAGNWDLKAAQPWSYRLQKWILNSTFLTKNMQVLVYGAWEGSSVNIKPFFTATYSEAEKQPIRNRDWNGTIQFLFVGALSEGKRPLYAVQLVEELRKKGREVSLQLFGEGTERELLEAYISENNLGEFIKLEGNQNKETVLEAYQNAHFLILASKSEGWPKVVAEAMFWGCIPVATKVSCVPNMLDRGNRGLLLEMDFENDVAQLSQLISNRPLVAQMTEKAVAWSRLYTLEKFESEIKALL